MSARPSDPEMATIALCPKCGRVVAASVDRHSEPHETAEMVAEWSGRGDVIDHMTVAEVHAHGWCDCRRRSPK